MSLAKLTDGELAELITSSIVGSACALTKDEILANVSTWRRDCQTVLEGLGYNTESTPTEQDRNRVYGYYLPVYSWIRKQHDLHKEFGEGGPVVVGISAPQGCGKTTLVTQLQNLMKASGLNCVSISIDDFYLTHRKQKELQAANTGNTLLEGRGNAGTHDLRLGNDTLTRLRQADADDEILVPRYDKAAFDGEGDRAAPANWPRVRGPVDVVLFEGWMLGFRSIGSEAAAKIDPKLGTVDDLLQSYAADWDSFVHSWLVVQIEDLNWVFEWRAQAERELRARGGGGMSDTQVRTFVQRYMPAYTAYLPGLYEDGPTTAQPDRLLIVKVDATRTPMGAEAV